MTINSASTSRTGPGSSWDRLKQRRLAKLNGKEHPAVTDPPPVPRPKVDPPAWDRIPLALRSLTAWVCWRYEWVGERWTEVPYDRLGNPAATNDPATWGTLAQARVGYERMGKGFDGIGLVLVDDLAGIDLDDVLDAEGNVEAWAAEVLTRFEGNYIELSPSGTGVHIICHGVPAHSGKAGPQNRLEVYGKGSARFLTVTGKGQDAPKPAQTALDWLHETHMRRQVVAPGPSAATVSSSPRMSDEAVMVRARGAENADKFNALWETAGGAGNSETDAALAAMLAFWTQDVEQIERLMRQSALVRPKWDDKRNGTTWLRETVEHAVELVRSAGEVYGGVSAHALRQQQRERAERIGAEGVPAPIPELLTLDEMRQRLVFISDGSRVALRAAPQTALAVADFKLHAKASQTVMGRTLVPTVDLWLQDEQRVTVHTVTFRPGAPEFTTDPEGVTALNLWRPRVRPPSSASVQPFLDHLAYLVPNEAERERFLDWLAHIEQYPGKLPHTSYLMVTPMTGIGRNWLSSLLARVWAGFVRLGFDLYGALHSGFNGPLSRRLLVVVDELKAADATGYGGANVGQQLKALLTAEHRTVNPKFGRMHIEFNCARFLMFSQHFDALPLERHDRRVIVLSNPQERRAPAYYAALYGLLEDDGFVSAVGHFLAARDLSQFNPNEPAPLTTAKLRAVEASASEIEKALAALRDGTKRPLMTASAITEYLQTEGLTHVSVRARAAAYEALGFVVCRSTVVVQGKRQRVVALREGEKYGGAVRDVLSKALESTE